jgi:hypothetical protein
MCSLSSQEVTALAEYFRYITAEGSFPPDSGSYSGNIPDLRAAVLRLDEGLENAGHSTARGSLEVGYPSNV